MMTSHGMTKLRREKGPDYDAQFKDLRAQLTDQLKVLDNQVEVKQQQLSDLAEFLRRRGDIEAEYARSLDKLTERFTHKTKRKGEWGQSVVHVFSVLLTQTRQESREHAALGETCCNTLTQRLTHTAEDTSRLAKRSREVGVQMQDELLKVTNELQTALRTYNQYHTECLTAEGKLKEAERLEERQTGTSTHLGIVQSGSTRRSSVKKMEKMMEKRHGRAQETQLKCTKARNEYLLNLSAANAGLNKYYLQDISTLIDCCDLGFHLSVERVIRAYLSSRGRVQKSEEAGLKQLEAAMSSLDQGGDRDALLQQHDTAFCLPFKFNYHPHEGDQTHEVSAEGQVRYELETRYQQLQSRLASVTLETEEVSKTLKATLTALLDSMAVDSDSNPVPDLPSTLSHDPAGIGSAQKLILAKRRANQQETEIFYFTKVKEFFTSSSLSSKLQAKHDLLQEAIQKAEAVDSDPSSRRRRMSRTQSTGQQIPVVVESCIRFINLHGLHHEGIFRVPGSQREVNHIRDAFERGEDPLSDTECDLDSVAGVLKLYFRGLEPPLFPYDSYLPLLECVPMDILSEKVCHIKMVVSSFPRPLSIVMRYLFAFLNHVTQYSDENMMQPYNLAVCFGPSLLRSLDSGDAVARQPQVNDLVKTMILQHDVIFPSQSELPGPIYEKHMTLEQEYCEPINEEGDGEAEPLHMDDEWEAEAMFDYTARSPAELSFKKRDILILHTKASADWWRGEVGGVKGLIPHKYICVLDGMERGKREEERGKREEERGKREEERGGGSTGNLAVEDPLCENTTRMRVNSDSACVGRQRGDGSPALKAPTSPASRQQLGCQERRHTLDVVRPVGRLVDRPLGQMDRLVDRSTAGLMERPTVDKEVISRQMNSVFKELLSRQPPVQPSSAPPSSSSSSSLASPLPPATKKGGFSLRGRALFRPADQ